MLTGKCALVTGSTSGIGYATARALASAGCNVVMNGLGDAAEIERMRSDLARTSGTRVGYHPADLSDRSAIADLVKFASAEIGPIDILVNDAVTRNAASIVDLPMDAWDRAIAVNLTAPFLLTKLVLPSMRAKRWGRIINISSNWGLTGTVNRSDYVATKHGLIGLTRATALETARDGITCNAICPGAVLTPHAERQIADKVKAGKDRTTAIQEILATRQATGRYVLPEQIAGLMVFLCSDAAAEMTGSPIPIDGAWSAY